MAWITLAQAAKLTHYDIQAGVYENIICDDDLLKILPWETNVGDRYAWARENALPDTQTFSAPSTQITAFSSLTLTQKTSIPITSIGGVKLENYIVEGMSDVNNQAGVQVEGQAKSIGFEISKNLIVGMSDITMWAGASCVHTAESGVSGVYEVTDTNEAEGLIALCDATQYVWGTVGGIAFVMTMFDEVAAKIKLGRPTCYLVSPKTERKYLAKLAALGGVTPHMVQLPNFADPQGNPLSVLGYNGVPVLKNDFIPTNLDDGQGNTDTTLMFALYLAPRGVHGIIKGDENNLIKIDEPIAIVDYDGYAVKVKAYYNFVCKSKYGLAIYARINA